jgi:dTDP-4-dehydrorhamnose reductase
MMCRVNGSKALFNMDAPHQSTDSRSQKMVSARLSGEVLVIGADSLIGGALMDELTLRGTSVTGTSRNRNCAHFFLDLAGPVDLSLLPEACTVFLCAGINGFAACSEDPATAALINVCATLAVGTHYMEQGGHVVFLSSTAVFEPRSDAPDEQAAPSPNSTYGALKCATEIALLEAARISDGECSVVRMTKVLSATCSLLVKWHALGVKGKTIEAFADDFIAPVSVSYVVHGLLEVADHRLGGCFHLTGAQPVSYADLAYELGKRQLIPAALIDRTRQSAAAQTTSLAQCNILAMPRTIRRLDIRPQPFANFLDSI